MGRPHQSWRQRKGERGGEDLARLTLCLGAMQWNGIVVLMRRWTHGARANVRAQRIMTVPALCEEGRHDGSRSGRGAGRTRWRSDGSSIVARGRGDSGSSGTAEQSRGKQCSGTAAGRSNSSKAAAVEAAQQEPEVARRSGQWLAGKRPRVCGTRPSAAKRKEGERERAAQRNDIGKPRHGRTQQQHRALGTRVRQPQTQGSRLQPATVGHGWVRDNSGWPGSQNHFMHGF